MASIRKLKKDINYLSYELLTEAFTFRHFHTELKEEKFDDVIKKIVALRNDMIGRINHSDEQSKSQSNKQYFKKIREEMFTMLEVMEDLSK